MIDKNLIDNNKLIVVGEIVEVPKLSHEYEGDIFHSFIVDSGDNLISVVTKEDIILYKKGDKVKLEGELFYTKYKDLRTVRLLANSINHSSEDMYNKLDIDINVIRVYDMLEYVIEGDTSSYNSVRVVRSLLGKHYNSEDKYFNLKFNFYGSLAHLLSGILSSRGDIESLHLVGQMRSRLYQGIILNEVKVDEICSAI